jgi:hypothetical protein
MILPLGKHAGQDIRSVPYHYVKWLVEKAMGSPVVHVAAKAELEIRERQRLRRMRRNRR